MQSIRYAGIEDVEAVSRIHAATWKEAYRGLIAEDYLQQLSHERWLPKIPELLEQPGYAVAVYEHKQGIGGLGGCVTFGPCREEDMAEYAEIVALYVLPQLWRQGLGRELLRFALDALGNDIYYGCYLWVLKGNRRACAFYESMGFSKTCEEKFSGLDGQMLHELRYELRL